MRNIEVGQIVCLSSEKDSDYILITQLDLQEHEGRFKYFTNLFAAETWLDFNCAKNNRVPASEN